MFKNSLGVFDLNVTMARTCTFDNHFWGGRRVQLSVEIFVLINDFPHSPIPSLDDFRYSQSFWFNHNFCVIKLCAIVDRFIAWLNSCFNSFPLEQTIYASMNWVIIGPGNGLSPVRRQAITWTNAGLTSVRLRGTYFSEIWIGIFTFAFKKMQ